MTVSELPILKCWEEKDGECMKLHGDVYLFVDSSEESRLAKQLLRAKGIPFKEINVENNGLRGWMLFEFGTTKAPILASGNVVLIGLNDIKKYLERLK